MVRIFNINKLFFVPNFFSFNQLEIPIGGFTKTRSLNLGKRICLPWDLFFQRNGAIYGGNMCLANFIWVTRYSCILDVIVRTEKSMYRKDHDKTGSSILSRGRRSRRKIT